MKTRQESPQTVPLGISQAISEGGLGEGEKEENPLQYVVLQMVTAFLSPWLNILSNP